MFVILGNDSNLKCERKINCGNAEVELLQQGRVILLTWQTKPHTLSNCKVNLPIQWMACNYSLCAVAALSHTRIYLVPTPTIPSPLQRRSNFI